MGAFGVGHCQIVGTVADIRQTNLSDGPAPGIYIPYTQEPIACRRLWFRTKHDPTGLAGLIRNEVAAARPRQPVGRVRHPVSRWKRPRRSLDFALFFSGLRRRCLAAFGDRNLRGVAYS